VARASLTIGSRRCRGRDAIAGPTRPHSKLKTAFEKVLPWTATNLAYVGNSKWALLSISYIMINLVYFHHIINHPHEPLNSNTV
jgi:hypothetical protein